MQQRELRKTNIIGQTWQTIGGGTAITTTFSKEARSQEEACFPVKTAESLALLLRAASNRTAVEDEDDEAGVMEEESEKEKEP